MIVSILSSMTPHHCHHLQQNQKKMSSIEKTVTLFFLVLLSLSLWFNLCKKYKDIYFSLSPVTLFFLQKQHQCHFNLLRRKKVSQFFSHFLTLTDTTSLGGTLPQIALSTFSVYLEENVVTLNLMFLRMTMMMTMRDKNGLPFSFFLSSKLFWNGCMVIFACTYKNQVAFIKKIQWWVGVGGGSERDDDHDDCTF